MNALMREGWRITIIPVDAEGNVAPKDVSDAIDSDTALVSIMAANNEVGTVQRFRDIGTICAERDVLFHTDLAQYVAYGDVDVERDNIHLASISAHKAYGPKGIGAVYIRSRRPRVRVAPIMYGGGQERGLRSGTLNVPAIVGLGAAMRILRGQRARDVEHLRMLTTTLKNAITRALPQTKVNGNPERRIPSNISFSIEGVEPLALVRRLRNQVSFSASSACATSKMQTSHVLVAMFGDTARARQAFRLSPGRFTTLADIECVSACLIDEARRLSSSAGSGLQT
jgi:cysteine desulfurase